MSKRQKISLISGIIFGSLLAIFLLIMAFKWVAILFDSMRNDIRITGLVVTLFSLIIAVCALVIAWNNFRRGNTAIVKLVELKAIGKHSVQMRTDLENELTVYIKNLGIPLHNAEVGLHATTANGIISIPFERFDINDNPIPLATLEKGMMGIFSLKRSRLQPFQKQMIALLDGEYNGEPAAADIMLGVFSSSFKVKEFPIIPATDWLRKRWDSLAQKLNDGCSTDKVHWGKTYAHIRQPFHVFGDHAAHLRLFVKAVAKDVAPAVSPSPPTDKPK